MEFNSGIPYSVAFASLRYGTELFTVKEGLETIGTKPMRRITRAPDATVSLEQIKELVYYREQDGMNFSAFGSATESQVLGIPVHDLQKQNEFLITRAEDEGRPHNAHDEVEHYHYFLMAAWPSGGMSWDDARREPELRKEYNTLLRGKGRHPHAIRGDRQYGVKGVRANLSW